MELNKLEKATKIFNAIKVLDAEIIEIDKIAMIVANGGGESSFELTVKEHKKQSGSEKVKFDEDGSLILPEDEEKSESHIDRVMKTYTLGIFWHTEQKKDAEKENKTTIKNELSEKATLLILGVLLEEKKIKRNRYLRQLNKMGVNIQ